MKIQTLIAFGRDGEIIDLFDIQEGKGRRVTPRVMKKRLAFYQGAIRFARITTHTLDGAGNV